VNNWLNIIQKKLLPPRCIFCGAEGYADFDLCAVCAGQLQHNSPCCPRCAQPFEAGQPDEIVCGRCIANPPWFDAAYAPYLYDEYLQHLIAGLKYRQRIVHARLLGRLLAAHVGTQANRPDCLIPVPLYPQRYRERGFNQALEIARVIARELDIALDISGCIRVRDTGHQTGSTARQRRKNLRGAFDLRRPLPYHHVAIVDDVMTTGATVNALAASLKRGGVSKIDVWVCARA